MQSSPRIDELKQKFHENPRRYFAPLANEYRKAGDPEQAIAICRAHLAQQPGHMSGHVVYGQALYDAGRIDEARGVFQQALALDPENLIVLRHLGDIARKKGEVEEARSWYSRALDGDPQDTEVAAYLAELTEPLSPALEPTEPEKGVPAEAEPVVEEPVGEAQPVEAERAMEPAIEPEMAPAMEQETQIVEPEKIDELEEIHVTESAWPLSESFDMESSIPEAAALDESPYLDDFPIEREDFSSHQDELVAADSDHNAPQETEEELASADMEEEGSPASPAEAAPVKSHEPEEPAPPPEPEPEPTPEPEATAPEPAVAAEEKPLRYTPTYEATPIVTRTLAELYLQQGYIEPALEIYRQLAEREPGDEGLRAKIDELSAAEEAAETTPEPEIPAIPEEPVAAAGSSELWDTADSWGAAMFEDVEEEDEIFGLDSFDEIPAATQSQADEESVAEESIEETEAPGIKTPAVEVEEAPAPRAMTIREFFATLGKARPPSEEMDELDEETADDLAADEAESLAEEAPAEGESYPYADDAFANLFRDADLNPDDSRAAAALSGAMAHPAPAATITTASQSQPSADAAPRADQSAQESEEDIRRFREWLEGLANS